VNPDDDEARLRAALAEAHRGDAERTPSFERVWAAARRPRAVRRSERRWGLLAAGVAAVGIAIGVWVVSRPSTPAASLPTGTRWTAPTDFLLDTPDLVTLRTVPALDPAADRFLRPPTDGR
jgi:hypothetical protein